MVGDKIRMQNEMSLDVMKNTVKRWDEGISNPSASRIKEICVKYRISPEELIGTIPSSQSETSDSLNMSENDQIYSIMKYFSMTEPSCC